MGVLRAPPGRRDTGVGGKGQLEKHHIRRQLVPVGHSKGTDAARTQVTPGFCGEKTESHPPLPLNSSGNLGKSPTLSFSPSPVTWG